MKAFITLCHKGHAYDQTLIPLFSAFEKTTLQECDVVIFPITYQDNYVADEELMKDIVASGKKIVIVDFVEYGWDAKDTNHIFGFNTKSYQDKFKNAEYFKLDEFLFENRSNISLYFKRELQENRLISSQSLLPIEYPGLHTLPTFISPATFEEYNNRPIDILMTWGLSNPSRPLLHGELCKQSALNGQQLVTNLDHIGHYQQRGIKNLCVVVMTPDFARESIYKSLHIQGLAKISVSLNGAGSRCFRHAESSYNSLMALQENGGEWTYPWVDYNNAIELPNREGSVLIDETASYNKIMECLRNPEALYKMYLNGTENWKGYQVDKYSENYILKEIQKNI